MQGSFKSKVFVLAAVVVFGAGNALAEDCEGQLSIWEEAFNEGSGNTYFHHSAISGIEAAGGAGGMALLARSGARDLRQELEELYDHLANKWVDNHFEAEALRDGVRTAEGREQLRQRLVLRERARISGFGPHNSFERDAIDELKRSRGKRVVVPAFLSALLAYDAGSRILAIHNGRDPGLLPGANLASTWIKRTADGPAQVPARRPEDSQAGR